MSKKALSDYVFTTKYANYLPEEKRRETYAEAGKRMFDMHREKFGADADPKILSAIDKAEEAFLGYRILGSQRAFQFGGPPVLKKNARLYNCSGSPCDRVDFFKECMWLLLCGCGTGFSVQKPHVALLPGIKAPTGDSTSTMVIPDTIEGWADALGSLVESYFNGSEAVSFDYTQIRPQGSPLSSGSGKAPGHKPLEQALERVRGVMDRCLAAGQTRLRPIDAFDIVMHSADAVLSGGVRRSATIALFSKDDEEMMKAKIGGFMAENPQRARANISAVLVRGETTKAQFEEMVRYAQEYGEPGFLWVDDISHMCNPCAEVGFYPYNEQGVSGWQFCNLSVVNVAACKTREDFYSACEAASLLGTLQAAYTNFDYLTEATSDITKRESLIGVSMTGIMESAWILQPEILARGADIVKEVNEGLATVLGINPAARTTTVKPEGTSSCLLQTSSGIHPHHARRYFRRAQANEMEAPLKFFEHHNPRAVDRSVWSASGTDRVVTFPVEAVDADWVAREMTALDLLAAVKMVKENWVDVGARPERAASPGVSHNVSNTVRVEQKEWDEVADFIFKNQQSFSGVTLLRASGDLDYPQAPFSEVLDEIQIVEKYGPGAIMASGLIVDGLRAFKDDLWVACDSAELGRLGIGILKDLLTNDQDDWLRRATQFAERYFSGDVREMCYCLKHVHNCKLWEDLVREMVPVDYSQMIEIENGTDFNSISACAGNSCEIL